MHIPRLLVFDLDGTLLNDDKRIPQESIDEINKIDVDIEKEIFVYGALCVCYSGCCYMSTLIGSRSGNRGTCSQCCRLSYNVLDENLNKLNKEEYKEFVDFTIDLHDWLVENKQIDNEFKDTIFMWLQLSTCINLAELETMISFERALIIYGYCSLSKNKLPRELLAEVSILLLRTTLRNMNVFDNYEVVKNYFEEMIDFNSKSLEKVVFKDYYKYIIKGYIANLINKLAYKVNDDIYKKYLAVYEITLPHFGQCFSF